MATAGRVLMIPAGDWKTGSNYGMLDVVVHLGSSYVAKNDINNSTKAPPSDLTNWQLLAQGYDVTNIVTKNKIVNNLLATDTGTVLSGPMGAELKRLLDQQNSDLNTGLSKKANTEDLNANKSGRMATGNIIVGTDFHQIRLQVENASQANKTLAVYDNDTKGIIGYIDFDR